MSATWSCQPAHTSSPQAPKRRSAAGSGVPVATRSAKRMRLPLRSTRALSTAPPRAGERQMRSTRRPSSETSHRSLSTPKDGWLKRRCCERSFSALTSRCRPSGSQSIMPTKPLGTAVAQVTQVRCAPFASTVNTAMLRLFSSTTASNAMRARRRAGDQAARAPLSTSRRGTRSSAGDAGLAPPAAATDCAAASTATPGRAMPRLAMSAIVRARTRRRSFADRAGNTGGGSSGTQVGAGRNRSERRRSRARWRDATRVDRGTHAGVARRRPHTRGASRNRVVRGRAHEQHVHRQRPVCTHQHAQFDVTAA